MIEIIFGIAGVWMMIVGKVPAALVGLKDHEITGGRARLIGFILALPMPIAIAAGLVLALLLGEDSFGITFFFEVAVLIASLITSWVLIKKFRTPIPAGQKLNA